MKLPSPSSFGPGAFGEKLSCLFDNGPETPAKGQVIRNSLHVLKEACDFLGLSCHA